MWSSSPLVLAALAVTVVAVSGASGVTGYKLGKSDGNKLVLKMMNAGTEALAKRDKQIKVNLRMYREDIATANRRKPSSVYCGPNNGVPEAASGTAGPGGSEVDRHDYGPDLRAARDALIRCNALIEVVK